MPKLSVIIPTLNESSQLPNLLEALNSQTRPPDEIIVADAGSKDGTTELAKAYGAIIVPGGMPGPGRNAGARAAKGDIFLFLDADVLPPPNFIECALNEFEQKGFLVATCPVEALSDVISDKIIIAATNLYLQIIVPVSPRAPGFCIFARREMHQKINGFDESLRMAEDHDYVRRASRLGTFGFLTSVKIPVSMRRLEKEGIVGLALKYLWCEMHALAGKPIRSIPFEYEFGAFGPKKSFKKRILINITELRSLLMPFENPLQKMSATGLKQLQRLSELDPVDYAKMHIQLLLGGNDLNILKRYIQKRLKLTLRYRSLTNGLSKIKNTSNEVIEVLDAGWERLFNPDEKPQDEDK